jgi:CheY-like chemotaxis protein
MQATTRKTGVAAKRVLIVDDNVDLVQSMAHMLRHLGHQVDFAINAAAAIELAPVFKPDVVFLDIGLPDARGYEVALKFRRHPDLTGARIVMITGLGAQHRDAALASGGDEFLLKPLDPVTVARLLER